MKYFLRLCFLVGLAVGLAPAQTITGTVVDQGGTAWSNAVVHAHLNNPVGGKVVVTSTGANQPTDFTVAGGSFSLTLTNTTLLSPGNTSWQIFISPFVDGEKTTKVADLVNASSQDISAIIAANLPSFTQVGLKFPGAYNAAEITPLTFGTCWLNSVFHCIINGADTPIGGTSTKTIAGATADFTFTEGTGTIAHDISGNGNNATLSATNPPAWISAGLNFTANNQSVTLPAAVNASKTFLFSVYTNGVGQNSGYASNFGLYLTSTLGPSGLNLLYYGANGTVIYMSPQSFSGSSDQSNCTTPISGFHVLGYTLGVSGTTTDHFYIDGVECTNYSAQGASFGFQTSGNLLLGNGVSGPFTSAGFVGAMYRVVALPTALTSAQILSATQQLIGDAASRGVPLTPVIHSQGKPIFFAVGDSITFGLGVSTPWESNLSLISTINLNVINYGISGINLSQIATSEANRVAPLCGGGNGPQVATVFAGTNDLFNGDTAANTLNYMALEIQQLKAAGCKVFVGTMLDRIGLDTPHDTYNSLLLQQVKTFGADGYIDFASDPLLGVDGASANATWFQADGIHPTQTGQNRMGVIASNSLNYYFGSSQAAPTLFGGNVNHQMISSEGYLVAGPTVAGVVITLPDCMGPSGATYTVVNSGGTQSLSVVGGTFNGLAEVINSTSIGTAVVIPTGSSVIFRDVRTSPVIATSGCHWEK